MVDLTKLTLLEGEQGLGTCLICRARARCNWTDGSKSYCSDCVDREAKKTATELTSSQEPGATKPFETLSSGRDNSGSDDIQTPNHLVSDLPTMHCTIGGKVYDLEYRNESCSHKQQKTYDALTDTKNSFCMECGTRMRHREKMKAKKSREIRLAELSLDATPPKKSKSKKTSK